MSTAPTKEVSFLQALFPVGGLITILVYGLIIRPKVQDLDSFPLEIVFLSAAVLAITQLSLLGLAGSKFRKRLWINWLRHFRPF